MSRNLLDSVPHVYTRTGVLPRYRSLTGTVGGFREDRCQSVPRWRRIGADHARGAWLWCLSGIDL